MILLSDRVSTEKKAVLLVHFAMILPLHYIVMLLL
jgi:hypothetical protein